MDRDVAAVRAALPARVLLGGLVVRLEREAGGEDVSCQSPDCSLAAVSHAAASAKCDALSLRLCTEAEQLAKCGGTGCQFDHEYVWTSDECTPPPKGVFEDKATLSAAVSDWIANEATAEDTHGSISGWDTSRVDDMSYLFFQKSTFNDDIGDWDTSKLSLIHI